MMMKKLILFPSDMKKRAVLFTEKELGYLEHIMWHFTDYMSHDDRPDHGLGILKEYRDIDKEGKRIIFIMAGRLRRLHRKWQYTSGNGF
jgi:hypothetical protein